eukprot:CAMPEP_0171971326 /NCGR_PEP_ID=MMETSP0993-20121228/217257_1 /TAXON_ID=483369 /ORGANISM="non described non described, Strain CCMP2098" /LENGTH=60 /DNA_ID=CAMNT_0012621653 /DNA_START=1 /DNA_END=180 /DNA_ORIENTATION=+
MVARLLVRESLNLPLSHPSPPPPVAAYDHDQSTLGSRQRHPLRSSEGAEEAGAGVVGERE